MKNFTRFIKKYGSHVFSFGLGVVVGSLFFSTKTTVTRYVSTKSGEDVTKSIEELKERVVLSENDAK